MGLDPRAVTLASLAGALALAWSIAVGWFYERSTRDIAMLAIPVLMAMLLDANDVVLEWSHSTFRHLATGSALLYAGFTVSALSVQERAGQFDHRISVE